MAAGTQRRQLNIRIDPALYQALEAVARQERRSLPQTVQQLLADGLKVRVGGMTVADDIAGSELAALAAAGGAFDWLKDEPDQYDDSCGEPL